MIIAVALSFALFLMGLVAVIGNLSAMYGRDADAARAAQDAALAGSAVVDIKLFLSPAAGQPHGPLRLVPDPRPAKDSANDICEKTGDRDTGVPKSTVCTLVGPGPYQFRIQAEVRLTVRLPIPIATVTASVFHSYSAAAQAGTVNPTGP